MKKNIKVIFFLLTFTGTPFKSLAQFTQQEIALRPAWEEFLKTAEIAEDHLVGHGVTRPIKLHLKNEDGEAYGVWKNPSGIQGGYLEGWQYEIAAYEMDKLVDLNMIPPTVERKVHGSRGSLQLWVAHKCSLHELMSKKLPFPKSKLDHFNKMKYLSRAFDSLIANEDRTQQNILYTADWRMILIDHSRSFRYALKFAHRLVFGKRGVLGRKLFKKLPRSFVEKVKALNSENVNEAVGPYLKKKEIEGILRRKKILLSEIQEMIKDKGEEAVLY
jgi:hypothetical protein